MFFDDHPYLSLYIIGAILVLILTFFKMLYFSAFNWVIKANILNKNLSKLKALNKKTWYEKIFLFIAILIFECALSWINVVVVIWQIVYETVKTLRDLFSSAPEEVKRLRFPIRNNPTLEKEYVWAYLLAIADKMGRPINTANDLIDSLYEVIENRPDFNFTKALKKLEELGVGKKEFIIEALEILKNNENNTLDIP